MQRPVPLNFPCLWVTLAKSLPLREPSFFIGGGGLNILKEGEECCGT